MAPALSFAQAAPVVAPVAAVAAAVPLPGLSGSDLVGPVILRDETVAQVLDLMQRWTGKSILRPQALPASAYTLTLPASITRDEALLAIETLLNLNGIAVIQQGDKFLKVVPNLIAKAESPSEPQYDAGRSADLLRPQQRLPHHGFDHEPAED